MTFFSLLFEATSNNILLALVNGQPVQLTLRKLLNNFIEFREHTILLRSNYQLKKIKNRQEIVEALIQAIKKKPYLLYQLL